MKVFIKILVISSIVLSCGSINNMDENRIITFNLKKLPKTTIVKLSDLGFVNIEYIPLETTEQSLFQRTINIVDGLNRLIFGDNFFIIKEPKSVIKFSDNGSFITKIATSGRGPDEFLVCHDAEIDDKNRIYIVDGGKRKLFIYSEQGNLIRTFNFPLYGPVEFRFIDDMFLCYSENHLGNVENSFNLIDTEGKFMRSYPNHYPFIKKSDGAWGFPHENLFYRFNNRLFKKEVYSDTIYIYEKMRFKPHIVIEVGDKSITPKVRSEMAGRDIAKNYIDPRNLFEFGDYIYYEFWYKFDFSNSVTCGFIGSKKNKYQVLIDTGKGLINDLDGGPNILPLTIKDDNTIVGCIDALQFKKHITSEAFKNSRPKYPEKKKELERLANSLKETDNPVLMLVRLKQ